MNASKENRAGKPNQQQFSLRRAFIVVTVFCGLFALPFGAWLVFFLFGWIGMAATVIGGLMLIQLPLIWILWRRMQLSRESDSLA